MLERPDSPLLVSPEKNEVIYPTSGKTTLHLENEENIDFACPGGQVVLNDRIKTTVVNANCSLGEIFIIGGVEYNWTKISCSKVASATTRLVTTEKCSNGIAAEIGFLLGATRFIRQIFLCFDRKSETTLYTQYEIPPSIGAHAVNVPRPQFEQDKDFFTVPDLNKVFTEVAERLMINSVLGLNLTDTTYVVDEKSEIYLSRSLIAGNTEFFYPAQQTASFKYVNAAPQWQMVNNGNWEQTRNATINYASQHNVNLIIWTGTYEVATLPHKYSQVQTQLFLYLHDTTKKIPVPAVFWKVVYCPANNQGVVLIVENNHPNEKSPIKHIPCDDVNTSITWLHWTKTNTKGYAYACNISDFRQTVTDVPDLGDPELLK